MAKKNYQAVEDIIELLTPHLGCKIAGNYEISAKDGVVTIKKGAKKKRASKAESILNLRQKIATQQHEYNFHEMCYAFEIFCRDNGYTYVSSLMRDTAQIKKVFPDKQSFGREELMIVFKYIQIFEKQIKTPTYLSPTWGGMIYAMPKIKQALRASENRAKPKQLDLVEEEY